jgi:hypothetical protein
MTASPRRAAPALLLSLLLLSALALLVAAGDVAASRDGADAAARVPQLTAEPSAVAAGSTLTLLGRGFPRNVHIALMAGPPQSEATRIGGATTGLRGRFSATIHIRPQASPGRFVAFACHDGCRIKATTTFRIVARPER